MTLARGLSTRHAFHSSGGRLNARSPPAWAQAQLKEEPDHAIARKRRQRDLDMSRDAQSSRLIVGNAGRLPEMLFVFVGTSASARQPSPIWATPGHISELPTSAKLGQMLAKVCWLDGGRVCPAFDGRRPRANIGQPRDKASRILQHWCDAQRDRPRYFQNPSGQEVGASGAFRDVRRLSDISLLLVPSLFVHVHWRRFRPELWGAVQIWSIRAQV